MPTWRALLLCIPWLACSSEPDLPPAPDGGVMEDAGSDAGTDPGDAGTDGGVGNTRVRVRRVLRYVTPGGVEEVPGDFALNPVELFVVEGETLVPVPGRPGAPGEYVFPNVPRAPCYVKVGRDYVLTEARDVDLGFDSSFRAGIEYPDGGSTLHVNLWGLEPSFEPREPSAPYPELHFVSEEVGYGHWPLVILYGAGRSEAVEYLPEQELPRFEQARGDRAWVTQLSPRVLGRRPDGSTQHYLTATRALHLPPFSHDGTAPLRIEGGLQELAMSELWLDWRTTEFASAAAQVHPAATPGTNSFRLYRMPAAPDPAWNSFFQLLRLSAPRGSLYDVFGTLQYGNPMASQESVAGLAVTSFNLTLEPSETPPLVVTATVSHSARASQLAAGPIRPDVLPPRDLTVDGLEAYSARTLTAGSHMVSWQPPSQGTPDAYVLRLMFPFRDGEFLVPITEARFFVDGGTTSVRLPPGLMQPGQRYYLVLEAVRSEGYAVSDRPLALFNRLPISRAQTLSGLLSVPAP